MCIPRGGMFRCRVLSDCNQAYRSFHWANWHMAMFHQSVFELAHLYQPPGGVRFMCMFCQPSRPCKDRTEFVYHCRTKHRLLEEVGTNNVTYICDICSQVFYTTKDLKSHLRDRYIRERIHCTYCGYVSRSGKPYALQRHYSTKHIGKAASTEK
jgi:DNA-directed RNA polymerase subunit RPC12/RpoP